MVASYTACMSQYIAILLLLDKFKKMLILKGRIGIVKKVLKEDKDSGTL